MYQPPAALLWIINTVSHIDSHGLAGLDGTTAIAKTSFPLADSRVLIAIGFLHKHKNHPVVSTLSVTNRILETGDENILKRQRHDLFSILRIEPL